MGQVGAVPAASPTGRVAVDGGIECGVVIHLELPIELEPAGTRQGMAPEEVETAGKVIALLGKDGEALTVTLRVARRTVGALGLFPRVIDLQRQDREPVDDEAGRFRVEFSVFGGKTLRSKPVEQGAVKVFGEIVAELVGAIDTTLDIGQLGVRGARGTGFVFDVPEVEVGTMLSCDALEPGVSGRRILSPGRLGVPGSGQIIVQLYNGVGRKHRAPGGAVSCVLCLW